MPCLMLHTVGHRLVVIQRNGQEVAIHVDGTPVAPLLPGWACDGVVDTFAPIHFALLRASSGARAVWILDASMQRIAADLAAVPEPYLTQLRQSAAAVFGLLHDTVLAQVVPVSPPQLDGLERLPDDMLRGLVALVIDRLVQPVRVAAVSGSSEPLFGFPADRLRAILAGDIRDDVLDVLAGRGMGCIAPDTGRPVRAQLGMVMPDRSTMYRFPTSFMGAFYITTRDYYDRKYAFYVPHNRLYVTSHHAPDLRVFLTMLLCHAARQHLRLCAILASPRTPMVPAIFLADHPNLHIGHVIWNDLTGLDRLARTLPGADLPEVVVINASQGSEPFGPVDTLFPDYLGRVRRPDIAWDDAASYFYDNNLFAMRFLSRRVTRHVRDSVLVHAYEDPRLVGDHALAARLDDTSTPRILLGLRVGNRTLQDQADFLYRIAEHLLARFGRVAIVVDGINSRLGIDPTTSYNSFGPSNTTEPLLQELALVFGLRRRYEGTAVTIVSTVGCPLASSLFWASRCSFFVAPWGAALAKYRWICNLPGFVVSNRHNIGLPTGDLPIYHDPEFLEDPSNMQIVALQHISDAPGASGFYSDFSIDPRAVRAGIDEMITLTGLAPMME